MLYLSSMRPVEKTTFIHLKNKKKYEDIRISLETFGEKKYEY